MNQNSKVCPVCGRVFDDNSNNTCTFCGFDLSKSDDIKDLTQKYNNYGIEEYEIIARKNDAKSKTFLTVSLINIFVVLPQVFTFAVIWLLFGALSRDTVTYYGGLLLFCGYFLASISAVVAFSINAKKKGTIFSDCIKAIIICFIIGIIIPIILVNLF